jgi:ATP diphosphatase
MGFDWPDIDGVLAKVREEVAEVEEAWHGGDRLHAQRELGDLLFAAVNLGRFVGIHPARALVEANSRFLERFALLREEVARDGLDFESCTLAQLDAVWERVKVMLEKAR